MTNSSVNDEAGENCSLEEYLEPMLAGNTDERLVNLFTRFYEVSGDIFSYYHEKGMPINPQHVMFDDLSGRIPCFEAYEYGHYSWETCESGLLDSMVPMAEELGVETRVNARVVGLVMDGSAVAGVEVEDRESVYVVKASKVVLATGGFQHNDEMMEQYNPAFVGVKRFAPGGQTGDGITLGLQAGAAMAGTGGASCLDGVNSSIGWCGQLGDLARHPAVVLNESGEVIGEGQVSTDVLADQMSMMGYGIFDSSPLYFDRLVQAYDRGVAEKYETIADLSEAFGAEQGDMERILADVDLRTAPFYRVPQQPLLITTLPGLKVDEHCRVLSERDEPIENLYAAGMLIFGNAFSDDIDTPGTPRSFAALFTSVNMACCSGAVAAEDAGSTL